MTSAQLEFVQSNKFKETMLSMGAWLAASLDDPNVCKEYKDDVNEYLTALQDLGYFT